MTAPTRRVAGTAARTLLATALAAGAVATMPLQAQAAASHYNTDPYVTGCADSKVELGARTVPGGTAKVWFSKNCGTAWISYSGTTQTVWTKTWDAQSGKYTSLQTDRDVSWAYSMQSYAPGSVAFQAFMTVGGQDISAYCETTCTWKGGGTLPVAPVPSPGLSQKLDAFVGRYKGVYIDDDKVFGAQCADLARAYRKEVVGDYQGFTPAADWGVDGYWYNSYNTTKWSKVGASQTARKGDLAIWKGTSSNDGLGHVALVLADEGSRLKVFTQNPGAAKIGYISKSDLLGYFRPKM